MADDIDQLLSARASADDGDIDALLAARASDAAPTVGQKEDPLSPARRQEFEQYKNRDRSLPWYSRAATGFNDIQVGAGQLMQHIVPDAALNAGRKVTDPILNAALGGDVDTSNTSAADFDAMVRRREAGYQGKREAAGQEGLDWWRIGGTVANPLAWLAPEGAAGGVGAAIANGAKAGLFQSLMQPVTADGNFLLNKGVQEAVGAAAGGTLGAALYALSPIFRRAGDFLGKAFRGADEAGQAAGAAKVTEDALKAAGADPAKVDPNLYSAIKTEVQDALKAGVTPDPKVMANRADASALPVPVNLTRGQASRDPLQFSWEVNTSKIAGAGEELNQRIAEQNRQLIENLNVLGAKGAPSQFDAAKQIVTHLENLDAGMRSQINDAYAAVRNSAGQSALKDAQAFHEASRGALESGQLTEFVPDVIRKQYNALIQGQLPLTVDIAQTLDKVWGAAQRGAKDDNERAAIGALRRALDDAPVSDQLGEASMAAYKTAKALAKQRFDLIDGSSAFKAVVDGVEPDKFFQKYIQGANVSELGVLKQIIGPDNVRLLQQTTLGNLKRAALNKASDENGVFSQSAYNRILQDPVQAPRLAELFKDAPETLGHLYRIGRVAENVQAFPKGHGVNTSNTAPTAANIVRDLAKSEGGSLVTNMLPRWLSGLIETGKEGAAKAELSRTVGEALTPGVTALPIKPATPPAEVKRLTDLLVRSGAAGAAAASTRDESSE